MREKTKSPFVKSIAKAAYPYWKGRKLYLDFLERPRRLLSYWDGGSKDEFVVVHLATLNVTAPSTIAPFGGENNPAFQLLPGYALVEHSIFCGKDGGCTVHLHPDDKAKVEV